MNKLCSERAEVQLASPGCEAISEEPLVVKNIKNYFHIHSYGGLSTFFKALQKGELLATRCTNEKCVEKRLWIPPRMHCPDCYANTEWVEAPQVGRIYTHTTILYPGSNFKLSTPCPLISVALEGACTKIMSYLVRGRPEIGKEVKAVFRTDKPTNTILDLAWETLD